MPPDPRRDRPSRRNLRRLWQAEVDGKLCRTPRERLEHRLRAEERQSFITWMGTRPIIDQGQIWLRVTAGENPDTIRKEMSR
jgi:hypothetical protein